MQQLLPEELKARLPPLYSQEAADEPYVHAKFFLPGSNWTWYVTEGEEKDDDFLFFGFVVGQDSEFGYFVLSELESAKSPLGFKVERDEHFTPGLLTDVVPAPE